MTDLAHWMHGTGLLPLRRDCLPLLPESVIVVPLLLLAADVGFLLLVFDEENVLLWKYNQSRITQARDKQVEEDRDQSMKGCSHKELDKDNYQQIDHSN